MLVLHGGGGGGVVAGGAGAPFAPGYQYGRLVDMVFNSINI